MGIKELLARLRGTDKSEAPEKREYARLVYPSMMRPKLKVSENEMDVIDISEKGIKFRKAEHQKIAECINGTAVLLSGKSIVISGKIVWEHDNEIGLLTTQIKESIIIEEIRTVLREKGSIKSGKGRKKSRIQL